MSYRFRKKHIVFVLVLLVATSITYVLQHTPASTQFTPVALPSTSQFISSATLRTKTAGCESANSLPDAACTPGATIPTATKEQVCVSGYSKTVRNVTASDKTAVYAEYGISSHAAGEYEVDHLISLELGGSNDIANLWPEAAAPVPGFHQKDAFENKLHADVCAGLISLPEAQREIATNWLQYAIPH